MQYRHIRWLFKKIKIKEDFNPTKRKQEIVVVTVLEKRQKVKQKNQKHKKFAKRPDH